MGAADQQFHVMAAADHPPETDGLAGLRILVVEDEAIVAMALSWTLTALGCVPVGTAATADEAMLLAAARPADLVLMDVGIKGEPDGIETALRLRRDFGLPVIFTTAFGDEETRRRAAATQPLGFLIKPYTPEQLQEAILAALAGGLRPNRRRLA